MPEEIDNFKSLISKIEAYKPQVITIDGLNGVGKTTLADDLKKILGHHVEVINLDHFLKEDLGIFKLKMNLLRNKFKEILNSSRENIVIIEGVLMRDVMEKLRSVTNNRVSDSEIYYIYYMKKGHVRGNFDSFYEAKKVSDLVEDILLRKQLFCYHQRFRPCERADVIYVITEEY